jgi:hypothetical protein
MPIDTVGEVVVAALEAIGDVALSERPKRSRLERLVHWSCALLFVGLLAFGGYLALG